MKGSGSAGKRHRVVYLDNAATSFPKPDRVWDAVLEYARDIGANPGRSGHRLAVEAARIVFGCRNLLSRLLGVGDPERVIFTKNATEAMNVLIFGLLKNSRGKNVVATSLEHNAVSRPLRYWCRHFKIELRVIPCGKDALVNPKDVCEAVDSDTCAVFVNHASNVFGTVTPFEEIARCAARFGIPVVLDTTQTLGTYPVSFSDFDNVIPVFTGHKGLLGPQGTGGFYLPEGVDLEPFIMGGTGSNSESDEQPSFLPDKFESGTLNVHGIAGLAAGVSWVLDRGVENIRKHDMELFLHLWEGLKGVKGVVLYGCELWERRVSVLSFNIEGMDPAQVAFSLDKDFGICCRPGLHCAPWAHRAVGTYPEGTVRFSLGAFNTYEDVEVAVDAVKRIAEGM